jgi:hypothetical protein
MAFASAFPFGAKLAELYSGATSRSVIAIDRSGTTALGGDRTQLGSKPRQSQRCYKNTETKHPDRARDAGTGPDQLGRLRLRQA